MISEKSNHIGILFIFIVQVCAGSALIMLTMLSGLIGLKLSPCPYLATFPNAVTVIGTVTGIIPFTYLINNHGWKKSIIFGLLTGLLATVLTISSLYTAFFYGYVISCFMIGFMAASIQFYIYAATRLTKDDRTKGLIVSIITSSGLLSALISPNLIGYSKKFFEEVDFIGSFLGLFILIAIVIFPRWMERNVYSDYSPCNTLCYFPD